MKTWLTPCAWSDDDGTLHIDVPRMLDMLGVDDTPMNREVAIAHTTRILEELLKDHPAVIKITE